MQSLNLDELNPPPKIPQNEGFEGALMPRNPFRMLVCGPSGSGKTNVVLTALVKGWITFDRLIVVAKDTGEAKYTLLDEMYSGDPEHYFVTDSISSLPDFSQFPRNEHTILLFDDLVCEGKKAQKPVEEAFTRARKMGCSCIYITQSFFHVPSLIRNNCDVFLFFQSPNQRAVKLISGSVSLPVERDEFLKLWRLATNEPHGFLVLDLQPDIPIPMRIRSGWTGLYEPQGEQS